MFLRNARNSVITQTSRPNISVGGRINTVLTISAEENAVQFSIPPQTGPPGPGALDVFPAPSTVRVVFIVT